MKLANGLMIAGTLAMTAIPAWAGNDGGVGGVDYTAMSGEARVLSEQEILDLLARSGEASAQINPNDVDIQYMGAESEIAISSELCCENVNEVVTERTQVEETETYIDAVTDREIIQPVERTLIQPVTRQVIQGRTETVTEATRYEEKPPQITLVHKLICTYGRTLKKSVDVPERTTGQPYTTNMPSF